MARNGSGTYTLPAGNPVVTGTVISSTWANNTLSDIATALTASIAADGQTPILGDMNWYGNDMNNMGVMNSTGPLNITSTASHSIAKYDSAAGIARTIRYTTNSLMRWLQGVNSAAESGSNAGSDWVLSAYDDAGTLLSSPISIARATGVVTFSAAPVFPGQPTTGDMKPTIKSTADAGWVMMNDGTIGNAASGATTRANADTEALFTLLWNNVSNTYAPVSGGRGANAAADFAANKTIKVLTILGRAIGAAGAGSGLTSRALGQFLGEETHALTSGENGPHAHGAPGTNTSFMLGTINAGSISTAAGIDLTTAPSTASSGSGTPHNNMQPTTFVNWMLKL